MRSAPAGRYRDRPPACRHADEEDGDRGDLPPPEHFEAGAGAQDLPLSAAQAADRAAQSGLGNRHQLHPDAKGFVYLVAIVDWLSRKGPAWRVSITMEADFCVEALEEALARFRKPEFSTPTRAASSRLWPSPVCRCAKRSSPAWAGGAHGATMS